MKLLRFLLVISKASLHTLENLSSSSSQASIRVCDPTGERRLERQPEWLGKKQFQIRVVNMPSSVHVLGPNCYSSFLIPTAVQHQFQETEKCLGLSGGKSYFFFLIIPLIGEMIWSFLGFLIRTRASQSPRGRNLYNQIHLVREILCQLFLAYSIILALTHTWDSCLLEINLF